jgi:uncharacterized protein
VRSERNAALKRRLTKPDARGARYQHHRVRRDRHGRQARRYYRRLAERKIYAPDLRGHVDELRATLQKPRVAERLKPHKAGRLVNQIQKLAADIDPLPRVKRSPDPTDDFLLSLSEGGKADYLVTGDKSGLLALGNHKGTRIVSARDFAALIA